MASSIARRLGTLLLVVVSSALAVLLAEGVLRLALNPADFLYATLIDDPVLGHRIEPLTTGHDALGFRNRETPAQANVVAIGDSFTYGVSAPRDGSWPHPRAIPAARRLSGGSARAPRGTMCPHRAARERLGAARLGRRAGVEAWRGRLAVDRR